MITPQHDSALVIIGGLVGEVNPENLPPGASPICTDMDFSVGSARTRDGVANVYTYQGADEEDLAGLGADVVVANAATWNNPNNITLDTPGDYATVVLNEPASSFSVVQNTSFDNFPASTSGTFSAGTITEGDVCLIQLFITVNSGPAAQTVSLSDNLGNAGTLIARVSVPFPGNPNRMMEVWSMPAVTGGASTVSMVWTVSVAEIEISFNELAGLVLSGSPDGTPATATSTSSPATVGPITTTNANDAIFAYVHSGGGSSTFPGDLTPIDNGTNQLGGYKLVSSTGSYSETFMPLSPVSNPFGGILFAWPLSPSSPGASFSDILRANTFGLTSPLTSSVLGLELQISGNQTEPTTVLSVKPTSGGEAETFTLPSVNGTVTVGGPGKFFGLSEVTSAQVNNPGFGFDITASDASGNESTVSIYAVELKIWFTPPDVENFNYVKTLAMQNEGLFTLAIDNTGVLWQEDVINNPDVLVPIYTALEPDTYAQSVTYDNREWIALSDRDQATDMPRQYNGQWVDRVSQVGPAFAPSFVATVATIDVVSITQPATVVITGMMWSSSPGVHTPGNTLTFWQQVGSSPPPSSFTANLIANVSIVNIQGLPDVNGNDPNGVYVVNSVQTIKGIESGDGTLFYVFSVTANASTYGEVFNHGVDGIGNYQITLATLTTATAVPNAQVGSQIAVAGASVPAWDETWTILYTPNAAQLNITSTSLSGDVATYTYVITSGTAPIVGQQVTVVGTTNGDGIFNVVNGQITAVAPNEFSLALISPNIAPASEPDAQAIVNGTIFQFDPGPAFVGTDGTGGNDPIFGNSTGGTITQPGNLGSGTRQAVLFFITRNGAITPCSPPVTFTLNEGANSLVASNILIGPPNVVQRGVAFTGAGGDFFYYIPQAVTVTSLGQKITYTSTIVDDNTSTEATFTFTDAVLLEANEIDIRGNNLFEQIELGSCLGFIAFANRIFAIGEQNKIQNLINLSFDGGYLSVPAGSLEQPAGWTIDPTFGANGQLNVSPLFGNSYYILNATGSTIAGATGMITQTAFQDYNQVPIIEINTQYGVRVTACCPSGVNSAGALNIDLFSPSLNRTYGIFTVPLSSMSTEMEIFTGNLLTTEFASAVPSDLLYRIYATGLLNGGDVEIDRTEPFDLSQPVLTTQLRGSYNGNFEAFDDVTGNLGVAIENQQEVRSAFTLFDNLYIVKTGSMNSAVDNGITEPDQWTVREVSNKVGTPSINGVDSGEGWAVVAGLAGVYVTDGGQPIKFSPEIDPIWETINWAFGYTLWVRNDTNNRRLSIGIPLPTPNQWMPKFPENANPTEPNVILVCQYKELMSSGQLASEGPVRQSYTGILKSYQLGRKWSAWSIEAAAADFITRANGTQPLFYCGDTNSAKIYQQISGLHFDDGEALLDQWVTYPFLKSDEAQQLQAGMHNLKANFATAILRGGGHVMVTVYPNTIDSPYSERLDPPFELFDPTPYGDEEIPMNAAGNRFFVGFESYAPGDWFELSRVVLNVIQDPWAPMRGYR
jgi:hypothetical protein